MTAKMNSELPVCCFPVRFTLLSFDFVLRIEMHSICNEVTRLNKPRAYNRNFLLNYGASSNGTLLMKKYAESNPFF